MPARDQEPVSGYVPGRSIVLVRNPSYDPATDGLRPAYPDRIETTIGGDAADLYNKVETGEVDYVADARLRPRTCCRSTAPTPTSSRTCTRTQRTRCRYISMNLGVPPFDDIHVRKALNCVVRQGGERQLAGGAAHR